MAVNFIATPDLPIVTLSATGAFVGTGAEFNLPVITLSATLSTGMSAVFTLPAAELEATLLAGLAFSAEFSLPGESFVASMLSEGLLSAEFLLPGPRLSAQVLSGRLFTATPELPALTLSAVTLQNVTLSAVFNLPAEQLLAELSTVLAEAYRTWVLNTRKNALTEYDFEFNSYALFQGQVLAAGTAGIVVLGTQTQDGTVDIPWRWRTGKADYGDSHLKRVPRIYIGMEATGDVLFRTILSEGGTRTYRLPHNHVDGIQQRRVPIGKGPKSRYFQYELEGEGGATASVHNLLTYPTLLRRRTQ